MLGELELSPVDIDWFSPGATHLLRMCSSGNLDLQTLRRACLFSLVAGESCMFEAEMKGPENKELGNLGVGVVFVSLD